MLVCVSILCTCFIAYISRTDWRKAAEEVTCAPTASHPASRKVLGALAGITLGRDSIMGLIPQASAAQGCPLQCPQ